MQLIFSEFNCRHLFPIVLKGCHPILGTLVYGPFSSYLLARERILWKIVTTGICIREPIPSHTKSSVTLALPKYSHSLQGQFLSAGIPFVIAIMSSVKCRAVQFLRLSGRETEAISKCVLKLNQPMNYRERCSATSLHQMQFAFILHRFVQMIPKLLPVFLP